MSPQLTYLQRRSPLLPPQRPAASLLWGVPWPRGLARWRQHPSRTLPHHLFPLGCWRQCWYPERAQTVGQMPPALGAVLPQPPQRHMPGEGEAITLVATAPAMSSLPSYFLWPQTDPDLGTWPCMLTRTFLEFSSRAGRGQSPILCEGQY